MKRALRRSDLSGTFVVSKYSFSPYMACEHGCLYCDGRAERYWVEGEFDHDIAVRRNLPQLLETELPRLRERGFVSIGSGISDAYQPAEHGEKLMRSCAEVLSRHGHPVTVMTKSALILRDLDLWRIVNERDRFLFVTSLVHTSDETRALAEPRAASVGERLEALGAFKQAGCATGVLAMPFLPGITDDASTVRRLYDVLAEREVDFIQPGCLTLRPGRQKEHYLDALTQLRPDLTARYAELYAEERSSGAPLAGYSRDLMDVALGENRRVGIPSLVPHVVYHGRLEAYDEAAVLLRHMRELYDQHGRETSRLKAATRRFLGWVGVRKREYNRHASWSYRELSEEMLAPGSLEQITANEKLSGFLREVLQADAVFDYASLRLR